MDLDPALIRAFVAVHEAGGFSRAALRLNLTQSAVSHQIRRLEENVGRVLFTRTTRKLALTEDGEDFLRHAVQILQAQDSLRRRFQQSSMSGVVRLGVPENYMGTGLAQLLRRFAQGFPAVRLEVSTNVGLDLKAKTEAGELDLAVTMGRPGEAGGTPLRRRRFAWAASETFELPDGASLPFAVWPPPCPLRLIAIDALNASGIGWHVAFTSGNQHGLCAAVLAGLAVSIFDRETVPAGIMPIDGSYGLPPLPEVEFALVWSEGDKAACARELGRLILESETSAQLPRKLRTAKPVLQAGRK